MLATLGISGQPTLETTQKRCLNGLRAFLSDDLCWGYTGMAGRHTQRLKNVYSPQEIYPTRNVGLLDSQRTSLYNALKPLHYRILKPL